MFDFAGGTNQRTILSGDFNVVANRGVTASINTAEMGHNTILSAQGLTKVTVGAHVGTSRTGTLRPSSSRNYCGREIDAIYARNGWWLESSSPNPATCRDWPASDPPSSGPAANPYEWSDHEMTVSPLMSPHGLGTSDL